MRLKEFDKDDEFAHSLSDDYSRTIKQRMDDIEKSFRYNEGVYQNYIRNTLGNKDKINDMITVLLQEVENFYDFCNNCNNDSETIEYLDRLIDISEIIHKMLDNLQ